MQIKSIKRPWQRQHNQGARHNPDPWYNSQEWKNTRKAFIESTPWMDLQPLRGIRYRNEYCAECWKNGAIEQGYAIDHIHRIKAGGSRTDFKNMQNLCKRHHASKSAEEANESKK